MAGRRTTNQWHSRGRNSAPLPVSTCHCALVNMGDRRRDLLLRVRLAVAHAALEAHAQFLLGFAVSRVVRADRRARRVADREHLLDASERLAREQLLQIFDVVVQAP